MKVYITYLVMTVSGVLTDTYFLQKQLPEDGRLNFVGLSEKYGHRAEEYSVVTEDGYILGLFRLPGKRKPPVLLLHGLADSADTYLIRGNKSLAITLANRGYDVWVGNTRGNKYSRHHTKFNPDSDPFFWDFSFHEHGYYDLAAITDYILNVTGAKRLQSIATSQGTTCHFVLGALRPEYNEKFDIMIALGPVAFLNNLQQPLSTTLLEMALFLNKILLALESEEMFPENGMEKKLLELVCNGGVEDYELCRKLVFLICGYDAKRLEQEFLPVAIGHYPTSTSRKSLSHYGQVAQSKRFALFDYGRKENLDRYLSPVPPVYNLTKVMMKTALFVGENDPIASIRDAEHIRLLLPNVVKYHVMKQKKWNHLDFVWSNDMPHTLFPHIFPLLQKYT